MTDEDPTSVPPRHRSIPPGRPVTAPGATPDAPGAPRPDGSVHFRLGVGTRARTVTVSEARVEQGRSVLQAILREPFRRRAWSELAYFLLSGLVAALGVAFIIATMGAGIFLAPIFIGLLVIAGSMRATCSLGGWQRGLARHFLDEVIPDPDPFAARPGFFGWLQASLRDGTAWRALAYHVLKIPLVVFGIWFALSVWLEALFCLASPLTGARIGPVGFGVLRLNLGFGAAPGNGAVVRPAVAFLYGLLLLFIAPWTMRVVIFLDRQLVRLLLGPDDLAARVRRLEESRAQTVDASAATLRRIERDLHDGTQAQLVALAMRLGQAKEQLADEEHLDLDAVRRLVDQAHKGAKEAITELRDLARGIHPPVLDTGLESALTTLTARAAVPTELVVSIADRPTPAIEAIAYFCVAELLANVAQHAQASRASVRCTQHGPWLRLVVRDDGRGGATVVRVGSSSSGLAGLTDRVAAVDGHLSVASPLGGPSVVTVDLPCHA